MQEPFFFQKQKRVVEKTAVDGFDKARETFFDFLTREDTPTYF